MPLKILKPEEALRNRFMLVVYGPTTIGKTTFLGTAPKPLVIDFEGGIAPLRGVDCGIVQVRKSKDFEEVFKWLLHEDPEKIEYQTICFDGLSNWADFRFSDLNRQIAKQRRETGKGGLDTRRAWGLLTLEIKTLVRRLNLIGKPLVITTLDREVRAENGNVIGITLGLPPSARRSVIAMADAVGYMYADNDDRRWIAFKDKKGFYETKDRFGVLEHEEPVFTKIFEKVVGGKKTGMLRKLVSE